MALDYGQLFEDLGREVARVNTVESFRDDLDAEASTALALFAEATGQQVPEHFELMETHSRNERSMRDQCAGYVTTTVSEGKDKILRATMRRLMLADGSATVVGATEKACIDALVDNMQIDAETVLENGVSAVAPAYPDVDNQGDWGAGAWSCSVAADDTGDHAQLIRAAQGVLVCTKAGYANQGAEEFKLYLYLEDTGKDVTSPTAFKAGDHSTGVTTEDVLLDAQGQQVAAGSSQVYTGVKLTIKGIDPNSISESGDAGYASAYDVQRNDPNKSPFNRDCVTFAYATGSRNGLVYLRFEFLAPGYNVQLFKDVGLAVPLSNVVNLPLGSGSINVDLTVASTAAALFDGLDTGDTIMRFAYAGITADLAAASETVTLGVPVPIGEGDTIDVDFTCDYDGLFQSYMVLRHGRWLPSDSTGSNTISETLAA